MGDLSILLKLIKDPIILILCTALTTNGFLWLNKSYFTKEESEKYKTYLDDKIEKINEKIHSFDEFGVIRRIEHLENELKSVEKKYVTLNEFNVRFGFIKESLEKIERLLESYVQGGKHI